MLYANRKEFDQDVYRLVVISVLTTIVAELAFTFYIGVYDFSNLVGHYFKIISFYLVYKAIIETGLEKPYNLMFRNLKRSEEELQKANDTKDTFFSIIAHDLKNPFQALISGTDFLSTNIERFDKDTIKDFMDQLHMSSENTYNLLQNLLAWSRSQTGLMECRPAPNPLAELVKEVISVLDYQAAPKQIKITHEIDDRLTVLADPDMISTVIRNLVSNAFKFTNKGGTINITAQEKGNKVECTITDTGVGMTAEKLQNLFRIEKKQSTLGTEDEIGTGIGLILSKEFINQNGGDIWAESLPDKGSTFTFTLPNARQ